MNRHRLFRPADLDRVHITGGFLSEWQSINRDVTIPDVLDKCDQNDRTRSVRLEWTPDADWQPHHFYDSDIVKAMEAAAYSIQIHPDPKLEARLEEYVSFFVAAQQPDGYLNSYYIQTGLAKRWTNLRDMHELYCAGHLFEAAVAHYRATGRRTFLDAAARYADHIDATFGPADEPSGSNAGAGLPTKLPGYPGHQEIEIGLAKLAEATGETRYLDLARFFVDERGRQPHYFDSEAERRGEADSARRRTETDYPAPYAYLQAHLPVREQIDAEGHSVRACYLYAGMVDVARMTDDAALLDTCRRLFASIADRRMYLTGGIGSHRQGERFTYDYDLPNESAYAETCAAISLIFFASRLLNVELDSRYADVIERALYNGALGGLSLAGDRYFYANPLAFHPTAPLLPHVRSDAERQAWYGCACCPPNIVRLIASLGSYLYSFDPGSDDAPTVAMHLYAESDFSFLVGATEVTLRQTTDYPWNGEITVVVDAASPVEFTLALRIPEWADGWSIENPDGSALSADTDSTVVAGYARVRRTWSPGQTIRLVLPLAVRRTYAHDAVRENGWKVALERGPIVYCLEEVDNGDALAQIAIPSDADFTVERRGDLLGGCAIVRGSALRRTGRSPGALYSGTISRTPVPFLAVPFALRNNRGAGEMRVWLAEV